MFGDRLRTWALVGFVLGGIDACAAKKPPEVTVIVAEVSGRPTFDEETRSVIVTFAGEAEPTHVSWSELSHILVVSDGEANTLFFVKGDGVRIPFRTSQSDFVRQADLYGTFMGVQVVRP